MRVNERLSDMFKYKLDTQILILLNAQYVATIFYHSSFCSQFSAIFHTNTDLIMITALIKCKQHN